MILNIRVATNAKVDGVEDCGEFLKVRVRAKPIEGKANAEVTRVLAEYLKVKESSVSIIRGATDRRKVVEITGL